MLRSGFIIVLHLVLVLKMYNLVESIISKPLPRCPAYKVYAYNKSVPSCDTSTSEGNQKITIENFPHIAILIYRRVDHTGSVPQFNWACHGTLISSRYVLTAAVCLTNQWLVLAKVRFGAMTANYFGEPDSSDYDIESTTLHPLYKQKSYYNNIGLIKLARKVEFSKNIRPICLPDRDLISTSKLYQVSYESTIMQIPKQRPLTKYEIKLWTNEECNANYTTQVLYGSVIRTNFPRSLLFGFTDDLFCLKKINFGNFITTGEAGAPIYINQQVVFINDVIQVACSHVQLGIATFGSINSMLNPEGATNVYHFLDWIENVIWADDEDI